MWNDTDTPLAFLISFRCYGTWLHGDARGSTDRHNNKYGDPKYPVTGHWSTISEGRLKQPPVRLDVVRRSIVEIAIRNVCEKREWSLYAVNIRTNHGHIVVANAGKKPEQMLNAFKANATREMREAGCWTSDRSPWADKGSQRWLWTDKHVSDAVEYVVNGQGFDLPKFD